MPTHPTSMAAVARRSTCLVLVSAGLLVSTSASASLVFEAFVPIYGKCHWAQINSETGVMGPTWPVESAKCPSDVNRTKAADGTQLFAVTFENRSTALWQLRTGAQTLDLLPPISSFLRGPRLLRDVVA
jgi:hypothetical protein